MGGAMLVTLAESCGTTSRIINANIAGSDLIVPLTAFEIEKKYKKSFKKYVVVQNDKMQYPICIYRFSDNRYEALLMRCTHQGTELQVFGDKMQCPAHGSEFDSKGQVVNGPASNPLRSFPVTIKNNQLNISLA